MSKKDYIALAESLRQARYNDSLSTTKEYQHGIDRTILALVEVLKADNPRFDYLLFMSAAQYGKLPRAEEVA